jgi:hypothetical protein
MMVRNAEKMDKAKLLENQRVAEAFLKSLG